MSKPKPRPEPRPDPNLNLFDPRPTPPPPSPPLPPPVLPPPDLGGVRNTDPDTSALAAKSPRRKGKRTKLWSDVLATINNAGPQGLTIWEITLLLGYDQRDSVSPRIREMRHPNFGGVPNGQDLVRDSGWRRQVVAHGILRDSETVWVATRHVMTLNVRLGRNTDHRRAMNRKNLN